MRDEFKNQHLDPRRRTLWLAWGSFLVSIALYGGVAAVIHQSPQAGTPPVPITLSVRQLLIVVGCVFEGVAAYVRFALVRPLGLMPAAVWVDDLDVLEARHLGGLKRLVTLCIVAWAIAEIPALLGLACFFMSRQLAILTPFLIMSAVGLLLMRPPGEEFYEELDRLAEMR